MGKNLLVVAIAIAIAIEMLAQCDADGRIQRTGPSPKPSFSGFW